MSGVLEFIDRRVRRPATSGLCVVLGSTPVISFGKARSAKVATLSLNPSHREFLDRNGIELEEKHRRLATLRSLGVASLSDAAPSVIAEVVNACENYFHNKPYRQWFNYLDRILRSFGVSYYDNTACHLDLVQWATSPNWSALSQAIKARLIEEDAEFLTNQLANGNIRLVLANGREILKRLTESVDGTFDEMAPITWRGAKKSGAIRLFSGTIQGKVPVIGWNVHIQQALNSDARDELKSRIAGLCQEYVRLGRNARDGRTSHSLDAGFPAR